MEKKSFIMYGNPIDPSDATGELKEMYDELKGMLGEIMPHIQLHATYMLENMDCFINPMKLTRNHPEIPLIWFVLMRLYVAYRDNYPYCKALNEKMLSNLGINDDVKREYIDDINKAPLKDREILLLKKAIKSIYDSHNFNKKDFEELYSAGYNDKTIYEIITYSTGFSGIAKRLNTYFLKEKNSKLD